MRLAVFPLIARLDAGRVDERNDEKLALFAERSSGRAVGHNLVDQSFEQKAGHCFARVMARGERNAVFCGGAGRRDRERANVGSVPRLAQRKGRKSFPALIFRDKLVPVRAGIERREREKDFRFIFAERVFEPLGIGVGRRGEPTPGRAAVGAYRGAARADAIGRVELEPQRLPLRAAHAKRRIEPVAARIPQVGPKFNEPVGRNGVDDDVSAGEISVDYRVRSARRCGERKRKKKRQNRLYSH